MIRVLLAIVAALGLACSRTPEEAPTAPAYFECVVPRPEVCTKEWRPVCGLRDTGVRCVTGPCDSWEAKTYGNACTACADAEVQGWRPGECEEEGIVRLE
jgi:hypothetical protein